MGVSGVQEICIETPDGQKFVSTATDKVTASTTFTVTCDSSKCKERNGDTFRLLWNEEAARVNPASLPDEFFHLIKVSVDPRDPREYVFCSPICVKDWLKHDHVRAKSPREVASEQQAVLKPDGLPSAEDLDRVEEEREMAERHAKAIGAVPDATGFSE